MAAFHSLIAAAFSFGKRVTRATLEPNDNFSDRAEEVSKDPLDFLKPIINFFKTYSLQVFLVILSCLLLFLLILLYRKLKFRYIEKLVYDRSFSSESVYAGGTVYLTETIYNPTLFPLLFIDVQEYIFGGLWLDGNRPEGSKTDVQEVISRFHLMPFMKIKRRHEVYCEKRGDFLIERCGSTVRAIPTSCLRPHSFMCIPV